MSNEVVKIVSPRPEVAGKIKLYKYVTVNGLAGLVDNGAFKVTYRGACNDPQELTPAGDVLEKSIYDYYGFLSFSKDGNNSSMWGNYAEHYKGACIELEFEYFNADRISEANKEEIQLLQYALRLSHKGFNVRFFNAFYDGNQYIPSGVSRLLIECLYRKNRRRVEWPQGAETMHEAKRQAEEFAWSIMCTKDICWKHEKEVRMPIYRGRDIINHTKQLEKDTVELTRVPTRYIKRIILGPLSEMNESELQTKIDIKRKIIDNADLYIPQDVIVVKAQFSKYLYELNYTGRDENELDFN